MMHLVILLLALAPIPVLHKKALASAQKEQHPEQRYCAERRGRKSVNNLLESPSSRLSFKNPPGPFSIGMCWWHSRFQRNAAYLALFRPDLPRPDEAEMERLIREIRHGDRVVEIPGYENLRKLSREHGKIIEKELSSWKKHDTFIELEWLDSLFGTNKIPPLELKNKMDKLYAYLNKGNVAFMKLRFHGVVTHSWLVIDMKKLLSGNGYQLATIDSNFPLITMNYSYHLGNTHFSLYQGHNNRLFAPTTMSRWLNTGDAFVPYLKQKKEQRRLKEALDDFCRNVP